MRTILVSAYACEPFKGSEQGVGWNWVLQMAKYNRVLVITRANNKAVIEPNIPEALASNLRFYYYDTHPLIRSFKKRARGLYLYYFFWQLGILPLLKSILKKGSIDYTMHLTMGSIWMPTFLPFFKTPFIWGPIGGGEGEPKSFLKLLSRRKRLLQYVRIVLNKSVGINPFIRYKIFRASKIICRTENTAKLIPINSRDKVEVILETAMEETLFDFKKHNYEIKDEVKLITTGRLMPSKNITLLVKALKLLEIEKKIVLTVVGSGPEATNIKREINTLGPNVKVDIIDDLPRLEVLALLEKADIFVFPSLREGGSWSLMEAMAIGLPVICLNWTGMALITDKSSAVQLPVTNPLQMQKDMALAITQLVENLEKRKQIGTAARDRIKSQFNWDAKGLFMEALFEEIDKKDRC